MWRFDGKSYILTQRTSLRLKMSEETEKVVKTAWEQYKWFVPFVVVVFIVMMVTLPVMGSYNTLVQKDIVVEQHKGNVQSALERRADLIPNFVATVEGSAKFEKSTLVGVIEARAEANQIKEQIKASQSIEDLQKSQDSLQAVIGRLLMLNEQYPTLQTTTQFRELEAQLTATENQINSERNNYNSAVMDYKMSVRTFPNTIIAGMFGFSADKWGMFQVYPGKGEVPVVKFDI